MEHSVAEAREAKSIGWNTLVEEHRRAWQEIWDETDVVIEGDPKRNKVSGTTYSSCIRLTGEMIRA